jgi:hypothetical protein
VRLSQLFGSLMAEAIAHDALPEDPWLRFQLDGSFQQGLLYVLKQGYWTHALKTVEFVAPPITAPPATTPIIGYPYSYPLPADFLRSHAYFVPAGDGREYPIDIKEDGAQFSTTAQYFAVRYVSSTFGLDPQRWPEPFLVALQSYLKLAETPDQPQQQSRTGQPVPAVATFRNVLQASLTVDGDPENPWYRFQRNGAFLRACFHVAETGRWKFAINTLLLEADAWIEQQDQVHGMLPANVYGDGSISPSYSAIFAKPADWLRTIWIYHVGWSDVDWSGAALVNSESSQGRRPIDFRDEGGNWHANYRHIQVRYIRRAAIESWRWPQSYADAVLSWLEYEEARTDPKLTQIAAAKQRIYEDMVDKAAKSDDSQEFPPYRTVGRLVRGRYALLSGIGLDVPNRPFVAASSFRGPPPTVPQPLPPPPTPIPPPITPSTLSETFVEIHSPTVNYTLPVPTEVNQQVTVRDASGTAGGVPITINGNGGVLINGVPTVNIHYNYGAFTFLWNGTEWGII